MWDAVLPLIKCSLAVQPFAERCHGRQCRAREGADHGRRNPLHFVLGLEYAPTWNGSAFDLTKTHSYLHPHIFTDNPAVHTSTNTPFAICAKFCNLLKYNACVRSCMRCAAPKAQISELRFHTAVNTCYYSPPSIDPNRGLPGTKLK